MTLAEIIGFILTLTAIWLAARGHVLTWPLQLAASLLYVWLFFAFNLFGEATLQGVYAILAVYGWWCWHRRQDVASLPVGRLSRRQWLGLNLLGVTLTLAIAQMQIHFLPTDVPVLDSSVFVFGLLAQWMQARKKLENWLYWIVIDLVAAGIYAYKALYVTALLYVLLAGIAVWGWRSWRGQAR
ncbi:nicotinamide riboside transporter PnuC [Chitinibacteraceae bacterium HSL-7]